MKRLFVIVSLVLLLTACSSQPKKVIVRGVVTEVVTTENGSGKTTAIDISGIGFVDDRNTCDGNPHKGLAVAVSGVPNDTYHYGQIAVAACNCVDIFSYPSCTIEPLK